MKKLVLIILALSCSCGIQKVSNIKVIDLLSQPDDEIANLSEIASYVEYIPLRTSENYLIGYIYDIKTDNTRIYLYLLTKILCFDKNGQFLYKLDNEGRGQIGRASCRERV